MVVSSRLKIVLGLMKFHWTSINYWNTFHILRVLLDNYLQLFSSKLMSGTPRVIYHVTSLVALGGTLATYNHVIVSGWQLVW